MSSDRSASFYYWLYLPTPAPIQRRPVLSWPGLPYWPASRSRSISRSRPRRRRLRLVIFAAIGLTYAISLLAAEWHYSAVERSASRAEGFAHTLAAAAWFPLAGRYRAAPAYFHSFYRGPQDHDAAMQDVTAALAADPYALDLRLCLLGLLLEEGREADAADEARHIHALAPKALVAAKVVHALPSPETGANLPP